MRGMARTITAKAITCSGPTTAKTWPYPAPASRRRPAAARRVRQPRVGADLVDVEVPRVVEVLRQPRDVEEPGRVGQELRAHQPPHLAPGEQRGPARAQDRARREGRARIRPIPPRRP